MIEADVAARDDAPGTSASSKVRRQHGNPLIVGGCIILFTASAFVGAIHDADRAAVMARDGILANDAAHRARVEYHVRWLIEAYRARNGFYPTDLGELQKSGLADPDTMHGVAALDLRYKLTGNRQAYTLL
jgi:hypothetical protein